MRGSENGKGERGRRTVDDRARPRRL